MKELRKKTFKNGVVYCLQLEDGFLVETTDTFLPYYTKDAIGRHQNKLDNNELGDAVCEYCNKNILPKYYLGIGCLCEGCYCEEAQDGYAVENKIELED